jgi:acetyl esterase/lipase
MDRKSIFCFFLGITSFVLYYRLVQEDGTYRYPVPMWDGQRALRYVRYNAAQFNINPNRIGIFGFSAGGHLASTIALHFDQNFNLPNQDDLDKTDARPDFLGLGYPVISMDPYQYASYSSLKHLLYGYTGNELKYLENFLSGQKHVISNTPPTFIFESLDDRRICAQNSVLFVEALQNAGIPYKALIVEHGRHGVGLAKHQPAERIWPMLFYNWLVEQKIISDD